MLAPVSFLKRSKRLEYFFNINQDGADTIKNVLNMYTGQKGFANYYKYRSNMMIGPYLYPALIADETAVNMFPLDWSTVDLIVSI